jgi:hypothetical protein
MPPELEWLKERFSLILSKIVRGIVYFAKRWSYHSPFLVLP